MASSDKFATLANLATALNNAGVDMGVIFSQTDLSRDSNGVFLAPAPSEYVIISLHGTFPEESSEFRTGGVTLVEVQVGASTWGGLSSLRSKVLSVAGSLYKYRNEGSASLVYGASESHKRIHVPVFFEVLST